ncbi:hypothetical protein [Helicobacter valdiviensis]|nr:hypothetical protein [Helicobacter valdiviensis]
MIVWVIFIFQISLAQECGAFGLRIGENTFDEISREFSLVEDDFGYNIKPLKSLNMNFKANVVFHKDVLSGIKLKFSPSEKLYSQIKGVLDSKYEQTSIEESAEELLFHKREVYNAFLQYRKKDMKECVIWLLYTNIENEGKIEIIYFLQEKENKADDMQELLMENL